MLFSLNFLIRHVEMSIFLKIRYSGKNSACVQRHPSQDGSAVHLPLLAVPTNVRKLKIDRAKGMESRANREADP